MLTLSICHHAAPATLTHNYPPPQLGHRPNSGRIPAPTWLALNYFKCQPKLVVLRQLNLTEGELGLGLEFNIQFQTSSTPNLIEDCFFKNPSRSSVIKVSNVSSAVYQKIERFPSK